MTLPRMSQAPRAPSSRAWLVAVLAWWWASTAAAHVELDAPQPRERARDRSVGSNLKRGPCGQRRDGRTSRVSVFEPGETIEVRFVEYVNHTSYYRVAFDVDGHDDFPVFRGRNVSREGDDPLTLCPVDGRVILAYDFDDRLRGEHTLQVELPDVECENCTLQLVQFMYGAPRPYYFQCADLMLRRGGGADAGAPAAGESRARGNGAGDAGAPPQRADAGWASDAGGRGSEGPAAPAVFEAPGGSAVVFPPGLSASDFVAPSSCWASIPVEPTASAPVQGPGGEVGEVPEPAPASAGGASRGCSVAAPPREPRLGWGSLSGLLAWGACFTARRRRAG